MLDEANARSRQTPSMRCRRRSIVTESGRGRAQLLAKGGHTGRMQSRKKKLRGLGGFRDLTRQIANSLRFGSNSGEISSNLVEFHRHLAKFEMSGKFNTVNNQEHLASFC